MLYLLPTAAPSPGPRSLKTESRSPQCSCEAERSRTLRGARSRPATLRPLGAVRAVAHRSGSVATRVLRPALARFGVADPCGTHPGPTRTVQRNKNRAAPTSLRPLPSRISKPESRNPTIAALAAPLSPLCRFLPVPISSPRASQRACSPESPRANAAFDENCRSGTKRQPGHDGESEVAGPAQPGRPLPNPKPRSPKPDLTS